MTGRQLYDWWSFGIAQEGAEVDEWEDIEPSEQAAWDYVATRVIGKDELMSPPYAEQRDAGRVPLNELRMDEHSLE